MKRVLIGLALGAVLGGSLRANADSLPPAPGPGPAVPGTPGLSIFGPDGAMGPVPDLRPGFPQGPGVAPAPDGGKAEAKPSGPDAKPPSRKEALDTLFAQLAAATDPDEAKSIAATIEHVWMHSGSDTADLLMSRAVAALGGDKRNVALALLDKVVALRPDWAEAWNKRATVRFLADDDDGSMEDIGHVLKLEPRHFGALSGMAAILKRHGLAKAALKALRRASEIDPADEGIRKGIEALTPDVEGRDL